MKSVILVLIAVLFVSANGSAQKKSWTEWDKKEVDRVLNDSAWGQTRSETKPVAMAFHPRLFSAKPIRQALARNVLLKNPTLKPEQMTTFVEGDFSDYIIIAVTAESSDRRVAEPIAQKFATATTESLKGSVYLEAAEGKRIYLKEYAGPTPDGTGAKFVFPRFADGKAVFSDNDIFQFIADVGGGTKFSWKFKLADMIYDGKLEY